MGTEFCAPAVGCFMEIVRAWALHPWPMSRAQGIATYEALGWVRADDGIESFTTDCTGGEAESFFYASRGLVRMVDVQLSSLMPPAAYGGRLRHRGHVPCVLRRSHHDLGGAREREGPGDGSERDLDPAQRCVPVVERQPGRDRDDRRASRPDRGIPHRIAHGDVDLRRPGGTAMSARTRTHRPLPRRRAPARRTTALPSTSDTRGSGNGPRVLSSAAADDGARPLGATDGREPTRPARAGRRLRAAATIGGERCWTMPRQEV